MSDKKLNYEYMKKAMHESINDKDFTKARLNAIKYQKRESNAWKIGIGASSASVVVGLGGVFASGTIIENENLLPMGAAVSISGMLGSGIITGLVTGYLDGKAKRNIELMNFIVRKNYLKQEFQQEFIDQGQTDEQVEANLSNLVFADYQTKFDEYDERIANYENENEKKFQPFDFVNDEDFKVLQIQESGKKGIGSLDDSQSDSPEL